MQKSSLIYSYIILYSLVVYYVCKNTYNTCEMKSRCTAVHRTLSSETLSSVMIVNPFVIIKLLTLSEARVKPEIVMSMMTNTILMQLLIQQTQVTFPC